MLNEKRDEVESKVYLDANIFLNVWFDEMIKTGEPFYASFKLLDAVLECKYDLILSDLLIRELAKKTSLTYNQVLDNYLKPFEILGKLSIRKTTMSIADEAVYLSSTYGIHKVDALHAIHAKSEGCILVTRDIALLRTARKYGIMSKKPEDLIQV